MTTDATDPRALGEELEQLYNDHCKDIAYRGKIGDAASFAQHSQRYEKSLHAFANAVATNIYTILDALRHRFASPQTAGEVVAYRWRFKNEGPWAYSRLLPSFVSNRPDHWTWESLRLTDQQSADTIASLTAERDALAGRVAALDAECERRVSACQITQEQAMQNGESAAQARAERDAALVRCEELEKALRDKELGDA